MEGQLNRYSHSLVSYGRLYGNELYVFVSWEVCHFWMSWNLHSANKVYLI